MIRRRGTRLGTRLAKAGYYVANYLSLMRSSPVRGPRERARDRAAAAGLDERIDYYLGHPASWDCAGIDAWPTLRDLRRSPRNVYFFDLYRFARAYSPQLRLDYRFGDVTACQDHPTIVKSRPIGQCAASVLFRLNVVRHFLFVADPVPWSAKQDRLVWRGGAYGENRKAFLRAYYHHPLCDVGHVAKEAASAHDKPFMSPRDQLGYKFVLSLEGNDVATNLKWILSSNSLCVMPRPRFETWFMEGRLVPGVHYVEIRDDYTDLPDAIDHYLRHPGEARAILEAGHAWVRQFADPSREALLSYRVLDEYFRHTGQLD